MSSDKLKHTTKRHARKSEGICLQVLPALHGGGVERGTVDLAGHLVTNGWHSIVASSGGPMVTELKRSGTQHVLLPLATKNPITIMRNGWRLARLIKELNVDVIHARSRAPAWSARLAASAQKIPLITTFHGTYSFGILGIKKPYNRVMASGDRVIGISHFIRQHILDHYPVEENKVELIYRGINLEIFQPNNVSPVRMIQLAKEWRLPDGVVVILLPGRLTSWKGHNLLLDALAYMLRSEENELAIRCIIVGREQKGSSYRSHLDERVANLGLSGYVQIVDECKDMPAGYMLSDVVVSASERPEAFGRITAEAQAMGRPVVAPAHGAASEILRAGQTGWLFTPSDPISLARALRRALSLKQEERRQIATDSIGFVAKHFNKHDMCNRTVKLYRTVLSGK